MSDNNKRTRDELEDILTEKENIFCHKYIIDWNGAKAARLAGYSEDSARSIASENLTKPHIKEYIDYIKKDIEKECGISKIKQINRLNDIVDDIDTTNKDAISATVEINKMLGYHETVKVDTTVTEKKTVFQIGDRLLEI